MKCENCPAQFNDSYEYYEPYCYLFGYEIQKSKQNKNDDGCILGIKKILKLVKEKENENG